MARLSKPLGVISKHLTKAEIQSRQETEERLKGGSDNITPSSYLTEAQIETFNYYVEMMEASKILSDLDSANLSNFVFVLHQLEELNDMANRNPFNITDKSWLAARSQLTKEMQRYTIEFCLSPTSRAKMGSNTLKKQEKQDDPLLKALKAVK